MSHLCPSSDIAAKGERDPKQIARRALEALGIPGERYRSIASYSVSATGDLASPDPLLFARHLAIALSPTLEACHDASGASCVTSHNSIAELAMQENNFSELRHCALAQCVPAEY